MFAQRSWKGQFLFLWFTSPPPKIVLGLKSCLSGFIAGFSDLRFGPQSPNQSNKASRSIVRPSKPLFRPTIRSLVRPVRQNQACQGNKACQTYWAKSGLLELQSGIRRQNGSYRALSVPKLTPLEALNTYNEIWTVKVWNPESTEKGKPRFSTFFVGDGRIHW